MRQEQKALPEAYQLPEGFQRGPVSTRSPKVVYIEVTNRCNLRCATCVRTFFDREPLRDLPYEDFVKIAQQFPEMQRAYLHGIGEPLLNKDLPRMIRYLHERKVEVIFNSNGTLLTPDWQNALIESGLTEYRCSLDSPNPATYARIRGADLLPRVITNLQGLASKVLQKKLEMPRVSLWCVVTRENLSEMPDVIRLAARIGVPEVYLQRLVYFARSPGQQFGMSREGETIFGVEDDLQEEVLTKCERLSQDLSIKFRASGALDPRGSLAASSPADALPWQQCLRPWTTAYITANGNCLSCCIIPFASADYSPIILGNVFEQPFTTIWNSAAYQEFRSRLLSDHPNQGCASCGVHWSL